MKNYQKYLIAAVLAPFAPLCASAQQNLLVQTSLSAALAGQVYGQGVTTQLTPAPVLVQVSSATGMVGLTPNLGTTPSQPNQTALYVDRELMYVLNVNGTTLTVVRGANGTVAAPHASGAMVLSGPIRFFYTADPGASNNAGTGLSNVSCTTANVLISPWINIRTGAQWLCSTITSTWVPGFNNPMVPQHAVTTTAVASAAGQVTPSGPMFHITGALAITGFLIPLGFDGTAVGGGCFEVIPDGTFTWTAANNIALAGTAVVNKLLTFCWDAKNSKWVPSYIA